MSARTPIHSWHEGNNGKLVDFAGWSLPIQYDSGIIKEHLACRKAAALFDVSHMGRFIVSGPKAVEFLQTVLTNDAAALEIGQAQYTLIPDEKGRPVDDAFLYRFREGEHLLVVNAANKAKDEAWLRARLIDGATMTDVSPDYAMLALQGPLSEFILAGAIDQSGALPPEGRNNCGLLVVDGVEIMAARTGYTGERIGFELFVPADRAVELWDRLVRLGKPYGLLPAGLGARDTLRLEAGLPLYGHELTAETPIMALPQARFAVALAKQNNRAVGLAALKAQATDPADGFNRKIVLIQALEKGMFRDGAEVMINDRRAGKLTSATMIPGWRFDQDVPGEEHFNRALALAAVDRSVRVGDEVTVVYRNKPIKARVVKSFLEPAGRYVKPKMN